MVGSPPLMVVPLPVILLLLLSLLSLSSPILSQSSPADSDDKSSHLTSSSPSLSTPCTVTPLSLSAINPQGTVYLSNITYYSITMPPTAPAGFKLKINQHIDYRTCAIDAFVGDDSNTCPDTTNNYKSSSGYLFWIIHSIFITTTYTIYLFVYSASFNLSFLTLFLN